MKSRLTGAAVLSVLAIAPIGVTAQTNPSPDAQLSADDTTVVLDAFTVTTTQDKGYKATNAIGATRTNTPIVDTPQSIGVFNDQFIEDAQIFDLTELTYFDPTFVPAQPDRGAYISRGYTVNATFVDGMPQRNTFGPNYTANVDRVEILKGPAAILYGQGAGGATINRVLKRAHPNFSTKIITTAGDNDLLRAQLDTMGPLGLTIGGRKLAYRINAVWQDGETFKRESENQDHHLSAAVSVPLGQHTDLDLNYTYDKSNLTGNFAHPVTNGMPGVVILTNGTVAHIPIDVSFGEPFDRRPTTKTLTSYAFRHQFNRHLSFHSQYQYETYDSAIREIFPQIGQYVITDTDAKIKRVYRERNNILRANRTRNELVGDFETGPVRHKLLLGHSFDETNEDQVFYQSTTAQVAPQSMLNPVYGDFDPATLTSISNNSNQETVGIARAFYANELAEIVRDRFFLQAGVRTQDTYQNVNNRRTSSVTAVTAKANTKSFGAVYHPDKAKATTLWAAISSSFEPNFRVNPDGNVLAPTTGDTAEAGIRLSLFGDVLSTDLSTYKTKTQNVPEAAPDLGDGYYRSSPGQTSEGFEASVSYNPSRRFQIYAGYAYLDAFDTRTGAPVANLSRHSISAFLRYEQPSGPLKGAFGTVGWVYRSTRMPTNGGWTIPVFNRVNLGAGYAFKVGKVKYRATASVENAFNDLLFGDNNVSDRYAMLAPRNWKFALSTSF